MQNEREKVEANEGNGVEARAEARQVSPVNDDNASEAEIDGNAQEGRGDRDPDKIAGEMVSSTWLDFLYFPPFWNSYYLNQSLEKGK